MAPKVGISKAKPQGQAYKDKTKPAEVRSSNIQAAKGKHQQITIVLFLLNIKFLRKFNFFK